MTRRFQDQLILNRVYPLAFLAFFLFGCGSAKVIQKSIPFDEERAQLSLDYLEKRYNIIQKEPNIVPRMIVVHYTVIPTFDKTYQAFYNAKLPGWRPEIENASALNVSSQYLIDQDGAIYQLLPDTVFARHVIGLNHCAIGIENVGGGKDLPLTKAQLKSNIALIKNLIKKYDIEYVIGHSEYQRFIGHPLWKETDPEYLTKKSDPGDEFMANIRAELTPYQLKPLPSAETAKTNHQIEILRHRLIDDALNKQGFRPSTERYITSDLGKAVAYLQQLDQNGRWPDVDYADRDNEWNPLVALDRILVMTYAYANQKEPLYHNPALITGIVKALEYWYVVNPDCKNWYKNDIAKQFYFNVIALLLQDTINDELLAKITTDLTAEPSMTGSNKTLVSISVIYRGVIEKDAARISRGVTGVLEEVQITTKEGVQPDYSFHQHGPFIYNGNYGNDFLKKTIWLASIVQGTSFGYTEEQMKVLRDYYLEGTRWMIRGRLLDYNIRGRQVGRSSGFDLGADKIVPQLDHFMLSDPEHLDFYQDSRDRILKNIPQDLSGNRHFWRSDYTAHHRPDYFTSLKMCSKRTIGMEMDVNTENLLGYYLPYGLTYIYRRRDEYQGIFPVWDWARLPGVTSPHLEFSIKGKSTQETTFVGSVSDGIYGVSSMDLDIQKTQAKKSWFWFDQEWVALGAGIQSNHEAPIVTGINQTLLQREVVVDGRVFHHGKQTLTHPSWVWHDSIAYIFPDEKEVVIKAEEQSGNLQRIFGLGADSIYRSDVFSLWVEHGLKPRDASYAYIVFPACSSTQAAAYAEKPPLTVLSNTTKIQAVIHHQLDLTGIAFHEAGEFLVSDDFNIKVDQPCLLLINHKKKMVTVSDPTAMLKKINITISNKQGEAERKLITLPSSEFAGSSVSF